MLVKIVIFHEEKTKSEKWLGFDYFWHLLCFAQSPNALVAVEELAVLILTDMRQVLVAVGQVLLKMA